MAQEQLRLRGLGRAALAIALVAIAGAGQSPTTAPAQTASTATGTSTNASSAPLLVVYAFSPTCHLCHEARKTVEAAQRRFGPRIAVEWLNVLVAADFERLLALEAHYGASESGPPRIFVGRHVLTGLGPIQQRLEAVIVEELARPSSAPASSPPPAEDSGGTSHLLQRFAALRVGTVATAGLVDGINPCAFTTIVLLLSMMAFLHKTRRQMALIAAAFTAAVFVTYFLLGVGLLHAIKAFTVHRGLTVGLTIAIAALAIVLGGWSLVDAARVHQRGSVSEATLTLPNSVRSAIHRVMRTGLRTPHLALGAFWVGVVVSLLESLCTGQVYLPTIMLVLRTTSMRLAALAYLLVYNLMFIVPLVLVTLLAYAGVRSDRLGRLLRNHLAAVKVAMGVLFVGLGVLLLASL